PSTHPSPPDTHTLSLHDALPIYHGAADRREADRERAAEAAALVAALQRHVFQSAHAPQEALGLAQQTQAAQVARHVIRCLAVERSEEHTSELQSRGHLVCRLLLE